MENYILIGNIVAMVSAIIMLIAGWVKKKKSILIVQILQMLTAGLSNWILGSAAGVINNLIGCLRNLLCYKNKFGLFAKIVIGLLATFFTIYFNDIGFIGYLPLLSTLFYIVFINVEDVVKFKAIVTVTIALWLIHDAYIKSYVYALFDMGAILANLISIIQIKVLDKKQSSN